MGGFVQVQCFRRREKKMEPRDAGTPIPDQQATSAGEETHPCPHSTSVSRKYLLQDPHPQGLFSQSRISTDRMSLDHQHPSAHLHHTDGRTNETSS
jgi:hypothetical protein